MNENRNKGGRPKASNPLDKDCKIRLDAASHERLMQYCDRHGMKKAVAIRSAIMAMLDGDSPDK